MVATAIEADGGFRSAHSAKGQQTRGRILGIATQLFAERGYDGTGIRDIETAALVNRGVVTYHFGNKAEIWKAAFSFSFLPYLEDLRSKTLLLRALDAPARLRFLIEHMVRSSAESPHLNQLMIRENAARSWRTDWIIENFLKPLRELNRRIGSEDPALMMLEADPHLRYAFLGACNMVFSLPCEVSALFGQNTTDEAFIQKHVSTVIGLLEGLVAAAQRENQHV